MDEIRIGERVAQVVALRRMSLREFSRRIGISSGYLSEIIRDLKKPGSEFFYEMKRQFGVSADWLLTGEGGMFGAHLIDEEIFKQVAFDVELAHRAFEGDQLAIAMLALTADGTRDDQRSALARLSTDDFIGLAVEVNDATARYRRVATIYNQTALITGDVERAKRATQLGWLAAIRDKFPNLAMEQLSTEALQSDAQSLSDADLTEVSSKGANELGTKDEDTTQRKTSGDRGLTSTKTVRRAPGKRNLVANRRIAAPKLKKVE